ncbi:MAG: UvrD-helicase domain-containing protein [Glaciecola sp.]|nr:UvrD-helicase domain-containing protein [Glaciecola sp.]
MILTPTTLAGFWHKVCGTKLTVELDSTNIIVNRNDVIVEFGLDELKTITVTKGWIFGSIVIASDSQHELVLKGYSSESLNAFKQKVIKTLQSLIASSDTWKGFQRSLEQKNNRNVYLSSFEWLPIAQVHKLVVKLSGLGIKVEQLESPLHKDVFKQAENLTAEDVSELGRELHNQSVVSILLSKYSDFFDTVEKLPLTDKQRLACVTNDDHNLVIAGAGTGKTSTLVGKAGFLVESKVAKPKNVLLLAFGNKAALEMNERINEQIPSVGDGFKASTFHALGNEIVANYYGYKKAVTPFIEQPHQFSSFINNSLESLAEADYSYKELLVNYFSSLGTPGKSDLDFKTIDDYHEFLSSCRLVTLKGEWVKSVGELRVANYLTLRGIEYEYEENYKFDTKSLARRQYQPDFYLPESGIYIEYLGLDKEFQTAPFVDQKAYLEGLAWKRELHKSKGTVMVELFSYQLTRGSLSLDLDKALLDNGVEVKVVPLDEIFKTLKEENETQWKSFIELIQRFLNLFKEGGFSAERLLENINSDVYDIERTRAFFAIFLPIYERYEEHLKDTDSIDFSDMIALAVEIIGKGKFFHSYTHILVDEFQDISGGRVALLKALLASKSNMRLFAVGDDWQSIYRFNGADIALFTEFNKSFSPSTAVPLDKTFRFNNQIHNVSSQFVMANPRQLKKDIITHAQVTNPALRLVDIKKDIDDQSKLNVKEKKQQANVKALDRTLNTFNRSGKKKGKKLSVLVIGRYRKENMSMLSVLNFEKHPYQFLSINYVTAHASKGLEADFVIVLGVEVGNFPSSRESDELIDLVLPQKESYVYAEERRLFYVALTRAKHFVYILFDSDQGSPFLTELNKFSPKLVDTKLAGSFAKWPCPSCESGLLRPLETRFNKTFYKCSLANACDTMMSSCKHCNSPIQTNTKGFRFCIGCAEVEVGCLRCGIGTMVARLENDPNRQTFYGCNRYRRGAEDSCGENIKLDDYERRYSEAKILMVKKR